MIDAKALGICNLFAEFLIGFIHLKERFHICQEGILYAGADEAGGFPFVDPVNDRVAARFIFAEKA